MAVETQHERPIKRLRSDNGGEYTSSAFTEFLKSHGIKRELTVARRPQQNGVSERMNRTLMEMTRTMIVAMRLSKSNWAEATNTAVYIRNRCCSATLPAGKTPYELWTGQKPSVQHLRMFGCKAWYKADDAGKLDRHARLGIFIGYSEEKKGYRIHLLERWL